MRDTYTIKNAYPGKLNDEFNEVEISSDRLIYVELGDHHFGCQDMSIKNSDLILEKCREVSKLMKEIDELNQE